MDNLTIERVMGFHAQVMKSDGGDDRLLSEAGLHQMVFSATRIEDAYSRAAFTFFSLIAYPVFRDGNYRTARLVAEMILSDNDYTLEDNRDEMDNLAQGIALFTLEQADIEAWLRSHAKKVSSPVSPV